MLGTIIIILIIALCQRCLEAPQGRQNTFGTTLVLEPYPAYNVTTTEWLAGLRALFTRAEGREDPGTGAGNKRRGQAVGPKHACPNGQWRS